MIVLFLFAKSQANYCVNTLTAAQKYKRAKLPFPFHQDRGVLSTLIENNANFQRLFQTFKEHHNNVNNLLYVKSPIS